MWNGQRLLGWVISLRSFGAFGRRLVRVGIWRTVARLMRGF